MKIRRILTGLVATIAMAIVVLAPTSASAATSGDFVSRINNLRASHGLSTLSTNGGLNSQAQMWAEKMAGLNTISHNPSLGNTPGNWVKVGENVGTGGTVDAIFDALVASPGHYRNMVEPSFNSIGVGVAMGSDGRIYTCHVFANYPQSENKPASTPAASSTNSTKSTAPAKTTTTTVVKKKASTTTTSKPSTTSTPKKAAATTTTTAVPPPAPVTTAAPAEPTPVPPTPSLPIVNGLTEVGSIATQG